MTQSMLVFGAGLFCFGLLGFLTRRNLILMFLSLEMMLAGVSLNFIAFGHQNDDMGGQVFVILILTIAACEAALALSLIVALVRSRGSLDVDIWQSLKEIAQPRYGSSAEAEQARDRQQSDTQEEGYGDLPKLTPAGLDPLQYPIEAQPERREPISRA